MRRIVALLGFTCILYTVQCTHKTNLEPKQSSDRLSSWPFNTNKDEDSRQSNGNPWSFLTDTSNEQESVNAQFECRLAKIYRSTIPTGRTLMSNIETTKLTTPEACIQACCDRGPESCQYAWMFTEKCFLIGCDEEKKNLCEPLQFDKPGIESTYYKVQLTTDSETMITSEETTPTIASQSEPTTTVAITTASEKTPDDLVTVMERPNKPTTKVTPDNQTPPTTTVRPTPASTTTEKPVKTNHGIIVATDGDTDISLPTNTAKIYGNTWPKPPSPGSYLYKWEKVSGPEQGTMVGKDDKDVTLRDLVPGVYTLRLKVTHWMSSDWGEGFINITVHEASHVNSPPVPIILPSSDEVITLPQDSIVLDAQSTTDDRGEEGLRFHWEEVSGPLGSDLEADSPVLKLSGLSEGIHVYKLTVIDSDGAAAVATAKVTVLVDKDYPPIAHAGNPVVLHLPNNEATLDGSASKDEGTLKYKWTYLSGPGGGDMEGANTATLYVNNLILGNHQYQLTVTDSSGQSAADTVSVIVLTEDNKPPVANAGSDVTVVSPVSSVMLSGLGSSDDYLISSFKWTQLDGPTDVTLSGVDSLNLTVSGLHIDEVVGSPTYFHFLLTVTDYRNLTDTSKVQVTFRKDPHIPPVASAGPDINITLPQSAVALNGTGSHDDFGIVSYQWSRSKDSPAAGRVMGGSDKKPCLIVSNLVNGTYWFTLKLTNKNGEIAEDSVMVTVLPNPSDRFLLQVHLDGDITQFTQVDVDHFKRALNYLLYNGSDDYNVQVVSVNPADTHIMVEFFAMGHNSKKILNTTEAYYKLTEKGQDFHYTSYHILKVEMKVCQLPCSGHGSCDPKTRKCRCSTYWVENPFKSQLGRKESNCDWSVFYVALVILGIVAVLLLVLWICCCCCLKRRRRTRSKRRIRYAILDNKGDPEAMQMLPKDYQQTSLMVSESETEEEILFESSRKILNNDTRKGGKNVKNAKILTGDGKVGDGKVGNQSSRSGNNNTD